MNLEDIDHYRVPKWKFFVLYKGASYWFSYVNVLAPASSAVVKKVHKKQAVVYRQLLRLQKRWVRRIKNLTVRKLWVFGSGETRELVHLSFRRRMCCTPENVKLLNRFYRGRPCHEYNFCPFCFARRARNLFKKAVKFKDTTKAKDVIASCRVYTYFFPARFSADNVWDEKTACAMTLALHDRLKMEIERYTKRYMTIWRSAYGSAWTVVVDPQPTGWNVEVRHFMLSKAHQPKPFIRLPRGAKTRVLVKMRLDEPKALETVLAPFVAYPKGLLYGFEELTAAALRARSGLKLFRTTGCLLGKRPNAETANKEKHAQSANERSDS